ncbi:hypothetical protein DE146DRAFT_754274 [Phaeosphaeria sp. MPI-PUGE-AT-0046c]|nr:hypothetical protein DE146DRAFT_754274 [Phaeosphaeria sp. MPI-PUGE-AT-0046c]
MADHMSQSQHNDLNGKLPRPDETYSPYKPSREPMHPTARASNEGPQYPIRDTTGFMHSQHTNGRLQTPLEEIVDQPRMLSEGGFQRQHILQPVQCLQPPILQMYGTRSSDAPANRQTLSTAIPAWNPVQGQAYTKEMTPPRHQPQHGSAENLDPAQQDLHASRQWLGRSQPDLQPRTIHEVPEIHPHIGPQSLPPPDAPFPMLTLQSIWRLRCLSPKERYDTYHDMVSFGLCLVSNPPNYPRCQNAWAAIKETSARLVCAERAWYRHYSDGDWAPVKERQEEILRVIQQQATRTSVTQFSSQQGHAQQPSMIQYQTGPEPMIQLLIAPPAQQLRDEPEVFEISSTDSSPAPQVQQTQANEGTASSQTSQRMLLPAAGANRKRKADAEANGEDDDENHLEWQMREQLDGQEQEERRNKMADIRAKKAAEARADELFYEENKAKVDKFYLGNDKGASSSDGTRRPNDQVYKKMSVWNAYQKEREAKEQGQQVASNPPPAVQQQRYTSTPHPVAQQPMASKSPVVAQQTPAAETWTAKRQKMNDGQPHIDYLLHVSYLKNVLNLVPHAPQDIPKAMFEPIAQDGQAVSSPQTNAPDMSMPMALQLSQSDRPAGPADPADPADSADLADETSMGMFIMASPSPEAAASYSPQVATTRAPVYEPEAPVPTTQAPNPAPFQPAMMPVQAAKRSNFVTCIARYKAMKAVQGQSHLFYLATQRNWPIKDAHHIVVGGHDIAQLLQDGVPHMRIVAVIERFCEE